MGTPQHETVVKVKHPSMKTIKAPIGTGQPETVVKVQHPLHSQLNSPFSSTGVSTGEPAFDHGERVKMVKHEHLKYDPTLPKVRYFVLPFKKYMCKFLGLPNKIG